jgi:hypothetical protein
MGHATTWNATVVFFTKLISYLSVRRTLQQGLTPEELAAAGIKLPIHDKQWPYVRKMSYQASVIRNVNYENF